MSLPAAPPLSPAALIVGCGYVGRRLAPRLIERGVTVFGTSRTAERAAQLADLGVRPLIVSVTQPLTFAALTPAIEQPQLDVYYLVPPGRPNSSPSPRQVVLGGVAHLVRQLGRAHVRRAVLASSTAVYGQRGGQRVDADTPPEAVDERAKFLLEGERLWREGSDKHTVVRFAGLYGPGRIVGLNGLRGGGPLLGDPQALLNLVHVDDAVELLLAVMSADDPHPIELGCDGHPVPRIDYYRYLANLLNLPAPLPLDDDMAAMQLGVSRDRLAQSSSKALDNIPTCRRTGWAPRYPNFRAGLEAALAASR